MQKIRTHSKRTRYFRGKRFKFVPLKMQTRHKIPIKSRFGGRKIHRRIQKKGAA